MTRLYVLVEGQTEEGFIKSVLAPHLQERGVFASALIVETSRDAYGRKRRGGGRWKHWFRDLKRLTGEHGGNQVRFTTLFDLYGLPDDFPGLAEHAADHDSSRRADALAAAMAEAVADHRLIPHLQRHEFEALVLASLGSLGPLLERDADLAGLAALQALLQQASPEDINDGAETAPSKRLERHIPSYRKTLHGPLAVEGAGLPALRKACPRFDAWVAKLEAL
jgi:hypothetical protein